MNKSTNTFLITLTGVNDAPTLSLPFGYVYVETNSGGFSTNLAPVTTTGPANESAQLVTDFTVSNNQPGFFTVQPYLAANGDLNFTLANNVSGIVSLTLRAHDNGGTANGGVDLSAPVTFYVFVGVFNIAPSFTFATNNVTVLEDAGAQTLAGQVANISTGDPAEVGQTVSFTTGNNNNPLFSVQPSIAANGTLTFTPAANASGSATVTVIATDSGVPAFSTTNTFTITVTPVNDAPSFAIPAGTLGGGVAGETWTPRDSVRLWSRVASSADGTKLLAATWGLTGRLYTSTDSGVTWTERASERGWYQVASSADGTKLVASPGAGFSDYIYTSADSGVTWTPRLTDATRAWTGLASSADGTKLVAVASGSQIYTSTDSGVTWTARDSARSWSAVASSADGTKLVAAVGGGQIFTSSDSGVTWTAQLGSGSHNWYYLASSADGTKLIAADDTSGGGYIYTSADSGVTWTARLTDTGRRWRTVASSADGNTLLAAGINTQIYVSTDAGSTWTARDSVRGLWDGLAISADGSKLLAAAYNDTLFTSTGGAVATPYNVAVSEDSGPQSVAAFATSISAGPANESAQVVGFTVANNNNALFSSQPALAANGTLTFTPAANANGSATVTVYAQDDGGTANGGVDTSAAQTFTITVTPVNDAPTITFATNNVVVLEDSGAFSGNLAAYGMGGGDSGQSITNVVTSNSASNLFSVQPVVALDGTLTFTPAANAFGSATVTVIAQDNGGTANGGVNLATNTFTITITPVNDAPSFALPAGAAGGAAQGPWTVSTLATGFNHAAGVVKDSVGNVFACNAFNNKITKITPGGTVSDFATDILNPGWMAIDGADNLYVTSTDANKVVKITPAGVVSDFAGSGAAAHLDGNGTSAQLNYPTGIARDSAGNLYVAEGNGNTIRKITPAGDVTTIAGTAGTSGSTDDTGAAARFNSPMGLGIDSADNLYVADGNNHTIRKVTPAGVVTTVAGMAGSPGAVDGTGSAARFYAPQDVKVDAAGNLLVADFVNHAVRQVTPAGVVTTIIGALGSSGLVDGNDSSVRLSQPRGLWVDTSGTVYIGEWGNNAVRKAVPAMAASSGSGVYTLTVLEDAGPQSVAAFATSISAGPANESAQVVSFVVTNDNNTLFSSQPAISTAGTLTFTTAPNANGSATVTVYAQDNGGTANGGVDLAGPQTFTITVTAVNDGPSAAFASNPIEVMKNSSPTNIAGFATFSKGPVDESSQSITNVTVNNNNSALFDVGGEPTIDAAGLLVFKPAAGAVGTATVTVITEDNGGTANGGVNRGTNTFVINVVSANIYVEATAAVAAGNTITVPVSILADGDENGVGFTLTFNPALLTFSSISAESGLTLVSNSAQAGSGLLGVVLSKPTDNTFASGYNPMVYVTFTVANNAPAGTTPIGFSSAVAYKQVTDKNANNIPYVAYTPNVVTITALATGIEGDVTPRPTGNGSVTVSDAVQIGRFAAGLDSISNFGAGSEFQRADCAPLGTQGDGRVTVADWVQTLRFAAGLDTPGAAGGPTVQAASLAASSLRVPAGNRVVRVVSGNLISGRANTVTVQVDAQGNESGLSLSLAFDSTAMTFVSAATGSGATGGSLMVNSVKAAAGKVGLVLVLPAGSTLTAGTRDVVTLTFNVSGSGATAISVTGDSPVAREVADVNANVLGASFVGGSFNIILPAGLKAAGMERAADGSLRLVVRNADGSAVTADQAAKYEVQVTSNLGGAWTVLPNALVVENGALKIVDPAAGSAGLRLYKLVEKP